MKRLRKIAEEMNIDNLYGYVYVPTDNWKRIEQIKKHGLNPSYDLFIAPTPEAARSNLTNPGFIAKVKVTRDDIIDSIMDDAYNSGTTESLVPILRNLGVEITEEQATDIADRLHYQAENKYHSNWMYHSTSLYSVLDDIVPENTDVNAIIDKALIAFFQKYSAGVSEHKDVEDLIIDDQFKEDMEKRDKQREEFYKVRDQYHQMKNDFEEDEH